MKSVYPLLLLCLIGCTLNETRAFHVISDVINRVTGGKSEEHGAIETSPVSLVVASSPRIKKVNPENLLSKTKDKRTQLVRPAVDPITPGENPGSDDIAEDVNEELKYIQTGREEDNPDSQWLLSVPEEMYPNQNKYEPQVSMPEEYKISDTSPETFVYKEYPGAANATFSDGLDSFQEQNEENVMLDRDPYGETSMPEQDQISIPAQDPISLSEHVPSRPNHKDFSQGGNNLASVRVGVSAKPFSDVAADGALPISANQIKGTFKINQGAVTGEGEYKINPEEVAVKVKMHIKTSDTPTPSPAPTVKPAMCLGPCPAPTAGKSTTIPAPVKCTGSPFEQDMVNLHNKYRAIHNAPSMTLNCVMGEVAMEYSQKLADLDSLVHSSYTERPEQGENLSMGCGPKNSPTAEQVVKKWYDEVCQYKFGVDGPQSGTAHFTQVVWKASVELGVGIAEKDQNGQKCTFIVARYKPQGDFDTGNKEYTKNIEKGSFDPAYCSQAKQEGLDGGYGFKRSSLSNMRRSGRSLNLRRMVHI